MDHADCMRGGQGVQHAIHLRCDLGQRARSHAFHVIRDRAALGQLHRVPRDAGTRVGVVDRHDGGMRQLRRELRFAAEACDRPRIARHVRMQQLERHFAAEREVAHAPHRTERAAADFGLHVVIVARGPPQAHFFRVMGAGDKNLAADHRVAHAHHAVGGAQHGADGREAVFRLGRQCPVNDLRELGRTIRPHEGEWRRVNRRRRLGGQRHKAERRQLPLVGRLRWTPSVAPLRGPRRPSLVRNEAGRNLGRWHGPLPAQQPESTHRRHPYGFGSDTAVHLAAIVEVRERRAHVPQQAHHVLEIAAARPRDA